MEKIYNLNIYSNLNEINDDQSDICSEKKYMKPTILENINLDKYFSREDIEKAISNKKILQITDKGLYSISKYQDAKWISELIKKFLFFNEEILSELSIIDSTAGIGGNTISFSKYFKKVYAIEINNIHYEVLLNNIKALKINNIDTYLDNFLNIINNNIISSSVFFLDPPWGGKNYKNYKYFNLKIGKFPIYSIINLLYDRNFKYVILKGPLNLNLSPIYSNIKYENMNIHSNLKKNMIICFFY